MKKRDERLHKFSQTVKERANDAASVAEVTAQMVRLYGGVDQFAVAWKLAIDEAVARGKSYLVPVGESYIPEKTGTKRKKLLEDANQFGYWRV